MKINPEESQAIARINGLSIPAAWHGRSKLNEIDLPMNDVEIGAGQVPAPPTVMGVISATSRVDEPTVSLSEPVSRRAHARMSGCRRQRSVSVAAAGAVVGSGVGLDAGTTVVVTVAVLPDGETLTTERSFTWSPDKGSV